MAGGQQITAGQGVLYSSGRPLLASFLGVPVPGVQSLLTGQSMTIAQGTVSLDGDDTFFDMRRRRRFGRSNSPLVTQWPPRRVR
jgi:hypothetical protein